MRGLDSKVVLITGAGRGLGRAAALRVAESGADVIVNDLDTAAADITAAAVMRLGRQALVSPHDVSDHTAAQAMVSAATSRFGRLDGVVNNAGILRDGMLSKMTPAQFDAVIKVNLTGVFNVTQAALAALRAQPGSGKAIVNVASISYLGNIGQTNYAAAKAGVVGMTRTWALELARDGIRVNAVAPGLMATDMTATMPEDIKQKMLASVPLRRMGTPDEFASAVAFLLSDESSYMTGHVLHLDGGSSVGGL